jgi:hypothetical protein
MVKAECEATAKAEAQFAAECTPPSVDIKYELSASAQADFAADASAQAAFEGKIQAVGKAFASLQAKSAKIEAVLSASAGLVSAAGDAVSGVVEEVAAEGSIRAKFNAACAVTELGSVGVILGDAADDLEASASGVVSVTTALEG